MKLRRKTQLPLTALVLAGALHQSAWADSFTVRSIKVEGLQGIQYATVLNYLPIHVGQVYRDESSAELIRELYKTGFFQYVELRREGDALVVVVVERATISDVDISGAKDIPNDKLLALLKEMGVSKGQILQRASLDRFKQQLVDEYNNRGKYNAYITTTVKHLSNNRVAIKILVSEGRVSRIERIEIIGNETFSDWRLKQQLSLAKSTLLTWFSDSDKYSAQKLQASLESLKSFYLNHGYLKFLIDSHQVSLSPDRKSVYISIHITEGPQYHFSGHDLSGKFVLPKEDLEKLVVVDAGDVFSREAISNTVENIGKALANRGYGFPNVNAEPKIDEEKKTVFVSFTVSPGRHTYVRRINFTGNTKTAEYVLRRVIRQDEGGLLQLNKVKESERQLRVLGYLKDVNVKTDRVPGTNNQVDLNFNVSEAPSAELLAQVSVSQVEYRKDDGGRGTKINPSLNIAFNQHNFMGTGQTIGLDFTDSLWGQTYSINHYNPFLSDNLGGGFDLYYQRTTPERLHLSAFSMNKFGGGYSWNLILSDHMSTQFGLGYQNLQLRNVDSAALQLQAFVASNGQRFEEVPVSIAWTFNNYDQMPYPTIGVNSQLGGSVTLPADSDSLSYYKATYKVRGYYPLAWGFIGTAYGYAGVGDQFNGNGLPFFENFFAGGITMPGMVRGYDNYSLGPIDSRGNPLGGNAVVTGSLGLILPPPLSFGPVRTTVFIDGGNIYSFGLPPQEQGRYGGPFRVTSGVGVEWRSPFGPLSLSAGWPFERYKDPATGFPDRTNVIQFTMSSSF